MGSLYKSTLGSMFETPIIAAARENRENAKKESQLQERELSIRERELAVREKEIDLELMKIKNKKHDIINGLIYHD